MDIKEFINAVEMLREVQKGCYTCFTSNKSKLLKSMEKIVDDKIATYRKEELEKLQGDWLINEH